MSIKQLLLAILFCSYSLSMIANDEKSTSTTGTIINDVIAMTDDIAEMIVVCKTEKDPKKIKSLISKIVASIATIIEAIIEKRKQKKLHRSFSLHEFDFYDISSQTLEQEIEQVIYNILYQSGCFHDN